MADEDLCLMPRGVRDKLDRIAIKLHLAQWQAFSVEEREELVGLPCGSEAEVAHYRDRVSALVRGYTGKPPTPLQR